MKVSRGIRWALVVGLLGASVFSMAAPASAGAQRAKVGVQFLWDGSIPGHTIFVLYADGTFKTYDGGSGTWTFDSLTKTLDAQFDVGCSPLYEGTWTGGILKGEQNCTVGSGHGRWRGHRLAGPTSAARSYSPS